MSSIQLQQEITSVGISCYGVRDGIPITDELSPGDQAIVDAVVACHDKNFTTSEKTALWALLDSEQQDNYTKVRDDYIRLLWFQELDDVDSRILRVLYEYKAGDKQDMIDDFEDNVEAVFPLWSDT